MLRSIAKTVRGIKAIHECLHKMLAIIDKITRVDVSYNDRFWRIFIHLFIRQQRAKGHLQVAKYNIQ